MPVAWAYRGLGPDPLGCVASEHDARHRAQHGLQVRELVPQLRGDGVRAADAVSERGDDERVVVLQALQQLPQVQVFLVPAAGQGRAADGPKTLSSMQAIPTRQKRARANMRSFNYSCSDSHRL